MASLDFPSSPTNGQTYTLNGVTYYYNSTIGAWLTQQTSVNITASSNTQVLFNDAGIANGSSGLVFDKVSGNLGVGTSSPGSKLHVYGSGDPVVKSESLTVGQAGQFSAIGNGASSYPGFNLYQSSTNYWSMQMRADTNLYLYRQSGSGNVYIPGGDLAVTGAVIAGGTSYSSATNSISLNNGRILMTKNDDWGIEMAGSNGTRLRFYSSAGGQTTTVGSVQVDGTSAYYYTGNLYVYRMGIKFPPTQEASSDANILDDYEEGTWTPNINSNNGTGTFTTKSGYYIKIGRKVTAWFMVDGGNSLAAGTTQYISGLPFSIYSSYAANHCIGQMGSNGPSIRTQQILSLSANRNVGYVYDGGTQETTTISYASGVLEYLTDS